MCTNGNKGTGDREMTSERLAATRVVEQHNASALVRSTMSTTVGMPADSMALANSPPD
jgi:hypothetical protein